MFSLERYAENGFLFLLPGLSDREAAGMRGRIKPLEAKKPGWLLSRTTKKPHQRPGASVFAKEGV